MSDSLELYRKKLTNALKQSIDNVIEARNIIDNWFIGDMLQTYAQLEDIQEMLVKINTRVWAGEAN